MLSSISQIRQITRRRLYNKFTSMNIECMEMELGTRGLGGSSSFHSYRPTAYRDRDQLVGYARENDRRTTQLLTAI